MRPVSQYQHLFFDMDGTLTPSRSLVLPPMKEALLKLIEKGRDVVIVSGAEVKQCLYQTESLPLIYLGQNGNHAYDGNLKTDMWKESLSPEEKAEILAHIQSIPRTWPVTNENDLIEDRGSQISYSLLGHHEDKAKKAAYDPVGEKRRALLLAHPLHSKTVEVKIGGTTTFDYFRRGHHKGYNLAKLIQEKGWDKDMCVYIGDALFEGGNDEAVIGIVDTHLVKDPDATLQFIEDNLGE